MKFVALGAALLVSMPLWAAQDERPKQDPGKDSLKAGLCASYYQVAQEMKKFPDLSGLTPQVCRVDPQINFEMKDGWGFGNLQWRELFAVVWTSVLRTPKDGKYTFYLKSDDGSKLTLDGKVVIDNDGTHRMDEDSKTVDLKAGDHDLRIEYFQNKDKAGCVLSWKYEGVDKQVIPASAFWHRYDKDVDGKTN
jgi:PA14 domain-containing protein